MAKDVKIVEQIETIEEKGGILEYGADSEGNLLVHLKGVIHGSKAYKSLDHNLVDFVNDTRSNIRKLFGMKTLEFPHDGSMILLFIS